jgi:hypothetical protein
MPFPTKKSVWGEGSGGEKERKRMRIEGGEEDESRGTEEEKKAR